MLKTRSLGKLFGVEVKLHGTFLILLAFIAISGLLRGGLAESILSVALAVMVFTVVVLHEFGHILAARHYGIPTKDVILSPIGGMARLQGIPSRPGAEAAIAAAGPAVNLVLAGLAFGVLQFFAGTQVASPEGQFALALTDWFLTINIVLLTFNLIPAIPMDGGRILRALLTQRLGYVKATQTAAKVARWSALLMAIYAIYSGTLILLLIAGFVFVMSGMEVMQARMVEAQRNPLAAMFRGFSPSQPPTGPVATGQVVDQQGRPVSGGGDGWRVTQVRWSDHP